MFLVDVSEKKKMKIKEFKILKIKLKNCLLSLKCLLNVS